jgi:hypothetical protein
MAKRRWKKEWMQTVASYHQRILERLRQDERAAIHQYKNLYFSIFREAYEAGFCVPLSYNIRFVRNGFRTEWIRARPSVTGDSIWQYAKERGWVHSEMKGTERRYKQIGLVQIWWDEWTFAWRQLMHKTRQYRTFEEPTADARGSG